MSNTISKKVLLSFSGIASDKPIVSELIRKYNLEINIYRAKIGNNEEGHMAIGVTGDEKLVNESLKYLKSSNVEVKETETGLIWDEEKCASCGNCLTHCPTKALHITDSHSRRVEFDGSKCIECLSCIRNCPFGACKSFF
ncbi:MAG: NIL domain-containing protein [Spirochaetales bacterium]|nr:NIL domain-containing protein [Spirochaetales bacterium]